MAGRRTYTASLFHQNDDATAQTYLNDAAGAAVYAGKHQYRRQQLQYRRQHFLQQCLCLGTDSHLAQGGDPQIRERGKRFAWEIVASDYAYLSDSQHMPSTVLPGAAVGGAGTVNRLNGTGWYTLDAKGVWRGWQDNDTVVRPASRPGEFCPVQIQFGRLAYGRVGLHRQRRQGAHRHQCRLDAGHLDDRARYQRDHRRPL